MAGFLTYQSDTFCRNGLHGDVIDSVVKNGENIRLSFRSDCFFKKEKVREKHDHSLRQRFSAYYFGSETQSLAIAMTVDTPQSTSVMIIRMYKIFTAYSIGTLTS